jgi:hypothetical protein
MQDERKFGVNQHGYPFIRESRARNDNGVHPFARDKPLVCRDFIIVDDRTHQEVHFILGKPLGQTRKKLARVRSKTLTFVVRHENSDRANPSDGEPTCIGIRAIAEFDRCLVDALTRSPVNFRIPVEGTTDGCLRQSQLFSQFLEFHNKRSNASCVHSAVG